MKPCRICGEVKALDQFHRAATARDGHRGECKACFRAISRARYAANPDAAIERARRWQKDNPERHRENQRLRRERPDVKARERDGHLRRKFRMTTEDYLAMLDAQGGGCAVCGREPRQGHALHVDHDHRKGVVRGLLCFSCNSALGNLHEDRDRMAALATYLDAHDPETQEQTQRTKERLAALRD